MIDINVIRNNPDIVRNSLKKRGYDFPLDKLIMLDKQRREKIVEVEALKNKRNTVSKEIGIKKSRGEDISNITKEMKSISNNIKALDEELSNLNHTINKMLLNIPNILLEDVPEGKDENDNIEIKRWGNIPDLDFEVLSHWELGKRLGILDFERAVKMSESRFAISIGYGARLEMALIKFFLDENAKRGYKEIQTPFMVNTAAMTGTGQLPKFEDDLYKIDGEDLWLIPTAEVSITNLYREEIIPEDKLPMYFCGYSPCFRKEAGAAGKETRGLIRLHQFNKVELVKIVHPDKSAQEHERLLEDAEHLLKLLKLPYRIVKLCSGDTSFSAAKCYDIEVYMPASKRYREISSCSNFLDFQSRRMKMRIKGKDKKTFYPHTLNGSGLPAGRTMAAIIENYQQADGSIKIPDVLVPYMGIDVIK